MKSFMLSPSQVFATTVGSSLHSPRSPMDVICSPPPLQHCSCSQSKPKRRRRAHKSVSFAEEALLYPSTLMVDEAASTWYSREELDVFKIDRRNLVKVLKQNDFDVKRVGNHYCLRGLEPYFSLDANKTAKVARESAMNAVFGEQQRQRSFGVPEPETLRVAVMEATQSAQHRALQLGSSDAAEARAIQESFVLEQLAIRADKGLTLGTRRGVTKTPSLTQQEAIGLARALQQRQN